MATDVIMPQMGFDMKEGTLVRWIKREGDEVASGDIIAEIETDKAVVEIEAFDSGVLRQTLIGEGTTVPVGEISNRYERSNAPVRSSSSSAISARPDG